MTRPKQAKHQAAPPWAVLAIGQHHGGMAAGDTRVLGDLTAQGISPEAIYAYARGLGVGDAFIKNSSMKDDT